jgi:hypothetical protein
VRLRGSDGLSAVSPAVQLDPAALVGAGGVVGVVDDRVAGIGFELAVDDHRGTSHDGHPGSQGEVVVHLHDPSGDLEAEALVAAVGALVVREHLEDASLDGHFGGPARRDRGDESSVVGLWVATTGEHPRQQQEGAERGDAGAERGPHPTILRPPLGVPSGTNGTCDEPVALTHHSTVRPGRAGVILTRRRRRGYEELSIWCNRPRQRGALQCGGCGRPLGRTAQAEETSIRRLLAVLTLTTALLAGGLLAANPAGAIVNGQLDGTLHPQVGALIAEFRQPGQKDVLCSGSLIAPKVYLTAAHCTDFLASIGITDVWVTFDSQFTSSSPLIHGQYVTDPA